MSYMDEEVALLLIKTSKCCFSDAVLQFLSDMVLV
jgi:hypothetical protein